MPEEELLPKPQTDLPLPEKELESGQENPIHPIVKNENPPKESKHLMRAFLLGFLFVVILAALGGAYFLRMNKTNEKANVLQTPTPTITSAPNLNPNTGTLYGDIKLRLQEVIK